MFCTALPCKNTLYPRTMIQNNEESRLEYWANRLSIRSFAHCLARGKVNDWMAILSVFFSIFDHSVKLFHRVH